MATIHVEDVTVQVPTEVRDLASFREWFHSDDFPEEGRIGFLNGEVWVDMSREQFFSHNQVRTEFAQLGAVIKAEKLGRFVTDGMLFVTDGMLLSSAEADFASQPDGAFLSNKSLDSGQVRYIEGKHGGFVELEGTPDMVLEIVSDSSVRKDAVLLKAAYAEAASPSTGSWTPAGTRSASTSSGSPPGLRPNPEVRRLAQVRRLRQVLPPVARRRLPRRPGIHPGGPLRRVAGLVLPSPLYAGERGRGLTGIG